VSRLAALLETLPKITKQHHVTAAGYNFRLHVIQSPECLSSVSDLRAHRICTRQLQTAVSSHPLKTGQMFIWTYLLGIVHKYLLFLLKHPVYTYKELFSNEKMRGAW